MITRPRRQNVPTTIEPHPRPPGDPVFQAAGGIQGSADSGAGMHGAFGNPSIGGAQGQVLQPQGGRQPHYYIHQPNSRLEASGRPIVTYLSWQGLTKFRSSLPAKSD